MGNTLRLTGGQLAGRTLLMQEAKWPVRPSTDKARLGLMNHLSSMLHWPNIRVLDLFAGTGSLGLECLSRGAASLTSVDAHPKALEHLQALKERWSLPHWELLRMDLFGDLVFDLQPGSTFHETPNAAPAGFDLILADPPYGDPRQEGLADRILAGNLLAEKGLLVFEHAPHYRRFSLKPWTTRKLTYGQSCYCIFEKIPAATTP